MLRNLIRAFLVLRLELREVPVDLELVLSWWWRGSTIEIVLGEREDRAARTAALRRRLDEVYPF
jgi:hypothetical protein